MSALVAAVVQDLFFGERVEQGLTRLGCRAAVAERYEPERLIADRPALLVVDLESPRPQWEALIRAAHAAGIPVLAFGSHVDREAREAALAAGATRVVAKSRFTTGFDDLIAELLPQGGQP